MICVIVSQALPSGDAEWEESTQAPFLHPAGGAPAVQECSVLTWDTRSETLRPSVTACPQPQVVFVSLTLSWEGVGIGVDKGFQRLVSLLCFQPPTLRTKRSQTWKLLTTVGTGRVGLGCFPDFPLASLVIRLWPSIDLVG